MMRRRTLKALTVTGALLLAAMGPAMAAGGPPDGGGGGEDETTVGNNLSMPVLFSEDGYTLTLQGAMDAPQISTVEQSTIEGEDCFGAPQKTEGNLWQADNVLAPGNSVSEVDWGDALESTDVREKMQRVETSLYTTVAGMTSYEMCYLSGKGTSEVWGALVPSLDSRTAVTTESTTAMVYTAAARLTIQRIVPDRTYAWDTVNHKWVGSGADAPVMNSAVHEKTSDGPGSYGVEVSVSGKIAYGYVWETGDLPLGEYRLTFSLDGPTGAFPGTGTSLAGAIIKPSTETEAVAEVAAEDGGEGGGGNTAVVVGAQNLTYIDVGLGTRIDPVPPLDEPTTPSTGGTTGGATTTPAPQAPVAQQGPEQITAPAAATARTAQTARIRAQASGRYPVGTVIVLARQPVKTSAGVTVRWRATTETRKICTVRTVKGKSTATLVKRGTCRVVGWAPAPSADYLPFTIQRTYRAYG